MQIPLKQLKQLLKTLEEGGATEFEYQDDQYRIRLARGHAPVVTAPASPVPIAAPVHGGTPPMPALSAGEDADLADITSPFVGTFYRGASPEAEPFVKIGDQVHKGQTLCIVEAMKLMNEIESEFSGIIAEILVENGASVEFGQKLFKLKKA
jgi:acetyl-CoA carboxylase biotin carboxyl carrier protein